MILPGMINQVWENIVQIHPWASSLSYPCFIKLPWLEVAPGDSICSAMRPCGLNLAILYLPLPSGFLSLLSVFAKWLHACIHVPSESSELQKKKASMLQNQSRGRKKMGRGGVSSWILYLLIIPNTSLSLMSNILAAFPLKSLPRWGRLIIFLSLKRASHGQFPLKHGHGKNQK